jgi:hypothetical protein
VIRAVGRLLYESARVDPLAITSVVIVRIGLGLARATCRRCAPCASIP